MANYFKCAECLINPVEKEGGVCPLCKQKLARNIGYKSTAERSTGCYRCKTPIDSNNSKVCPECGGLKCHICGACWCKLRKPDDLKNKK